MGILDVVKGLFGLGQSVADLKDTVDTLTSTEKVSEEVEEEYDESMDAADRQWADIQKEIKRVESEGVDLVGIDHKDAVAYWTQVQKIEAAMASGKSGKEAAMASGYRDWDHWEEVSNYVVCKWSEMTTDEEGEKAVRTPEKFVQASITARNQTMMNGQAAAAEANPELLAPVNGVSLETWASCAAALAALGTEGTEAQVDAVLAAKGLDRSIWEEAQAGWTKKMQEDKSFVISTQFGQAFNTVQA